MIFQALHLSVNQGPDSCALPWKIILVFCSQSVLPGESKKENIQGYSMSAFSDPPLFLMGTDLSLLKESLNDLQDIN